MQLEEVSARLREGTETLFDQVGTCLRHASTSSDHMTSMSRAPLATVVNSPATHYCACDRPWKSFPRDLSRSFSYSAYLSRPLRLPRFLSPSLLLLSFPSYWDSTFTRAVTTLDTACLPVEHGMNVDAYDNEARTGFSLRYKDTVAMSERNANG